jgi:hypothetical protein
MARYGAGGDGTRGAFSVFAGMEVEVVLLVFEAKPPPSSTPSNIHPWKDKLCG